jgi:ABC-type multidrug transport system ATPase subunit
MNDNRNAHTLTITTQQLTRRFGDVIAVEALDLQVPRGSVYGFLGPNGAGKTTTIRMLLGLIRPDDGEVHIFGQSLRQNRLPILRQVGALVESPSAGIHEMRDLICRLPEEQGITVFLSSHLLSEVEQVATHIGIINQGRLLFQGPLDALHAQVDDHLTLEVDQPQRAKHLLQQAGWVIKRNGNQQLVVAVNGHSDVAMLNAQLVHNGLNVYHLHLEHPTLETMFLALTA